MTAAAFATHAVRLLTDAEYASQVALNGRAHVARHFDWNRIGENASRLLVSRLGLTAAPHPALHGSRVMKICTDCRHYRTSVPCRPHKQSRVCCDSCSVYAAVDERILIVKLDAMGDVLRTTACLEPLRRLHPRSHVTWITRRESLPLLSGNPCIDRVLTIDSAYLEFLLAEDFDLALGPDTDPLAASIMQVATATEKRGFVGDRRGGVIPQNDAAEAWWRMGQNDTLKRQNRRTYGEWLYAICELPGPVARPSLHVSPDGDRAGGVLSRLPRAGCRRGTCA